MVAGCRRGVSNEGCREAERECRRSYRTRSICLPLLVGMIMVTLLSGCGSKKDFWPLSNPEKRTVGVVLKSKDGDYWNTVRMGAEAAAKEFDVSLNIVAPDYEHEIEKQVEMADQVVKLGAHALVLAASDYMALGQVVDQTSYRQVPVISIDSEVGSTKVRSFIGTNPYAMGRTAGQKWAELVDGRGKVVIMNFVKGARNAEQREEGLLDVLARYSNIEVKRILYSDSDIDRAYYMTKELLDGSSELGRVDGIISLNATSSIGVARAVREYGAGEGLTVVTIDSTPELMGYVQDGTVQAAVVQNPFTMGYLGVKYAVEAMRGESIPEREETDIKLIDLNNMFRSENQKLLFPFVK